MRKTDKPIIIAICGKSASGKDYYAKYLFNKLGTSLTVGRIISDTTRPPRKYEQQGIDYRFIGPKEFRSKKVKNRYLESTKFNKWLYGTPKSAIAFDINIGVFNLDGLKQLYKYDNEYNIISVYIDCPFRIRLKRSYQREKKFKLEFLRRALIDHKDFKDLNENNFIYIPYDNIESSLRQIAIAINNFYNTGVCEIPFIKIG